MMESLDHYKHFWGITCVDINNLHPKTMKKCSSFHMARNSTYSHHKNIGWETRKSKIDRRKVLPVLPMLKILRKSTSQIKNRLKKFHAHFKNRAERAEFASCFEWKALFQSAATKNLLKTPKYRYKVVWTQGGILK